MRRSVLVATILALSTLPVLGQDVAVSVSVFLVDAELNLKPVPRHALVVSVSDGQPIRIVTGHDGKAEAVLPPGEYTIESERALEFRGRSYSWLVPFSVKPGEPRSLELSTDNATIADAAALAPPPASALPALFKEWEGSIVTVWSDLAHGTGFLVDEGGLIITNQHVVHLAQFVAVQIDEKTKVRALPVAQDIERDVAVLWVDPAAVAGRRPVQLQFDLAGGVEEGQQVFTIGSPLNQRKVMTTGIVSKIESRALISDININHGNSGGPLFTMDGHVIGITTFGDLPGNGGPGISGIVRMSQARSLLDAAKAAMQSGEAPEGTLLPVEPLDPYPPAALKQALAARRIDARDYSIGAGDFEVQFVTPVLQQGLRAAAVAELHKEQTKRAKKAGGAAAPMSVPSVLGDLRNWAEYVGENQAVFYVQAMPKLKEGFWSGLSRGLAASQGHYGGPAKLKFATDFVSMKLFCGAAEVQAIQPGRIEYVQDVQNWRVSVRDAAYAGLYAYAPDAIGPHCPQVRLQIVSLKDKGVPQVKDVPVKLVTRVWEDFGPFRDQQPGNPQEK